MIGIVYQFPKGCTVRQLLNLLRKLSKVKETENEREICAGNRSYVYSVMLSEYHYNQFE